MAPRAASGRFTETHPDTATTRYCPDCDTWKDKDQDFYRDSRTGKRFRNCKPCQSKRTSASRRKRVESGDEEFIEARRQATRKQNFKKYGVTEEEFEKIVEEQGGVCYLCKKPPSSTGQNGKRLHVDHCHLSGKNRRALCGRCNVGLGMFGDDSALLRLAADYVDEFRLLHG